MLNIKLPRNKYNLADYPNLDDRMDGAPIPIAYGDLHNIIPTCINTVDQIYKLADHAIHSIDEIRAGVEVLDPAEKYTVDLANAQFTLNSTPLLAANTTYYLVIEVDYAPSATDHIHFVVLNNPYADGKAYWIDNSGTWDDQPSVDFWFKLNGRYTLDGAEVHIVDNRGSTYTAYGIRDTALPCLRYRLAQSFKTGALPIYATRVELKYHHLGATWPGGNMRVAILSTPGPPYGGAEVQAGSKTDAVAISSYSHSVVGNNLFPLVDENVELSCDIEGMEKAAATIVDGADFIEDLISNAKCCGKSAALLDAVALANFKAKRTQAVAHYADCDDATAGKIIEKLESSLLFKFVRLHDGTYATVVYESGEPAGTPHFKDEHFLSFSMRRNFSDVKGIVQVQYDEEEDKFKISEAASNVAKFVYGVEDTLELQTYLKESAGADWLRDALLGMYETPPLEVEFEVRGYGLNLLPGRDKVKITRTRAAYAGGALNAVLFRIVKIQKKLVTATTIMTAILDTQTY